MTNATLDAIISPSRPVKNRLIFITIRGLTAIDGSELHGDVESMFSTAFDPFYASAMRIRLIAGEFLTDIPDDTLNQLIQYYSHQADLMNFVPEMAALNPNTYRNYRARWVTAAVIVSLLSGSTVNGLMQKRLGDLMVKRDRAANELLGHQREELRNLTAILEDGGNYGRDIETVVKGSNHPDFISPARQWARPGEYAGQSVPVANSNLRFYRRSDGGIQRVTKKGYAP